MKPGDKGKSEYGGFQINICNDTIIPCLTPNNEEVILYNSSIIYRDQNQNCTRIAGPFYKGDENDIKYLEYKKDKNEKFIYGAGPGDVCLKDYSKRYSMKYVFKNTQGQEWVDFNTLNAAGEMTGCEFTLEINANFEQHVEHLIIQKFFSDYFIPTGIILLLGGVYLLILAQNKKATKFVVGVVFGEIFIFGLVSILFSINIEYMEWAIFPVGLIFGGFIGYFCLGGYRLYNAIVSLTAGFIFGLIMFDIIFVNGNYQLTEVLFTDSVLIFMGIVFSIIYLIPEYHYFCNSIIGGYLFIRGLTTLLHKVGKYARYRELQLLLYLIHQMELDYAKDYYDNAWPIYFVYDILMILIMGASGFYYYVKYVGKDLEKLSKENEEKDAQENLVGGGNTTNTDPQDNNDNLN